jgi:hypothetical protein
VLSGGRSCVMTVTTVTPFSGMVSPLRAPKWSRGCRSRRVVGVGAARRFVVVARETLRICVDDTRRRSRCGRARAVVSYAAQLDMALVKVTIVSISTTPSRTAARPQDTASLTLVGS